MWQCSQSVHVSKPLTAAQLSLARMCGVPSVEAVPCMQAIASCTALAVCYRYAIGERMGERAVVHGYPGNSVTTALRSWLGRDTYLPPERTQPRGLGVPTVQVVRKICGAHSYLL